MTHESDERIGCRIWTLLLPRKTDEVDTRVVQASRLESGSDGYRYCVHLLIRDGPIYIYCVQISVAPEMKTSLAF